MLSSLADQTDATAFGYGTITTGAFARASARVRSFAKARGYAVDDDTYTIKARGPFIDMTSKPVRSVTSVTDYSDPDDLYTLTTDEWTLRAGGVLETPAYGGNVVVVFTGGLEALPDELVELVCAIASRMSNTLAATASGVQQETGGSESVTFGFDSYTGISDLTTGELHALSRMFPVLASQVVLRP